MVYKIQKTIISKYIELVDKEVVAETEIAELLQAIEHLYKSKVLTQCDIYRQKLEIITKILSADLDNVKRKRTNKEIKLGLSPEIYNVFIKDISDNEYKGTALSELDKLDTKKEIQISFENVSLVLENIVLPKRKLTSEADFEKFAVEQLIPIFGKENVHRQYSIGGFLALKTDIDIGNGLVGIENKIIDNMSATDMQRMMGQIIYYKNRFYHNNLIVFVASKTSMSPTMQELKNFIEELGIRVIFKQAVI